MKLNKNGWGTLEMILLSGGLLVALIVAIFFISKLYGSFGRTITSNSYVNLESKLETAAKDYIIAKEIEINGEYKINYDTLKNAGYITDLKDSNGNNCYGYVIINNIDNVNHYSGYITCQEYQTANY